MEDVSAARPPPLSLPALCARRASREHLCDVPAARALQAEIDASLAAHAAIPRPPWAWRATPMALAGGDIPLTVCSHLGGYSGGAQEILSFLNLEDAFRLVLVCKELRDMVGQYEGWRRRQEGGHWEWPAPESAAEGRSKRFGLKIEGSLSSWRAANPQALRANIEGSACSDADFAHLAGVKLLDCSSCRSITDSAFQHLKGIHALNMSYCSQAGITDSAFQHLKGIHTLDMSWCRQAGITDAAFQHLKGIHTLWMSYCSQAGITDAAFQHLKGIQELNMSCCNQDGITDAAFQHLKGIYTLNMRECSQAGITDAAFQHLKGIHKLAAVLGEVGPFAKALLLPSSSFMLPGF